MVCVAGLGCNDLSGLAGKQQLPAGIPDPSSLKTRAGALAAYQIVLSAFQMSSQVDAVVNGPTQTTITEGVFVDYVFTAGLLTDELAAGNIGGVQASYDPTDNNDLLDARQLPEIVQHPGLDALYTELQGVRNSAILAIGSLSAYDTVDSPALRGQLYALSGYSELLLADLYCSGVPLSTLDFQGDFTYRAGSTTDQLYQAAIAQFDTAIALSSDSTRILNLARVGLGRAYLARAIYDSASLAVDNVSTDYSYQFLVQWIGNTGGATPGGLFAGGVGVVQGGVTEADTQGTTGLPYLSSDDPRTEGATWGTNSNGVPQYAPTKYGGATLGTSASVILPITVADGIEARLIQAEAAYHGVATGQPGTWIDQLNALRATIGLSPIADPGTGNPTAQIDTLMAERAFWLYLTGHRQGDLRRMIRNYGLSQNQVYPTGRYLPFVFPQYGTDVTVPIPITEHGNPLFTGCFSRGA